MLQRTFVKSKGAYKIKFTLQAENAQLVELFGLNNDWENPILLKRKKDGSFAAEVALPKDTKHEFKYRINQKDWLLEEDADKQVPNVFGTKNSMLVL